MNLGERLADKFAAVIGSWRFIILQTTLLVLWIVLNTLGHITVDTYPYTFLNLLLSVQAAFTGPILLLSSNRQSLIDRRRAVKNLVIDQQGHAIIIGMEEMITQQIAKLREDIKNDSKSDIKVGREVP